MANGLEIAYERVGVGPLLVLVHGSAEDGRVWQPQLAALADEFTVVSWDEPGAGRSTDVPADFGLADYANCFAALIETLAPSSRGVLTFAATPRAMTGLSPRIKLIAPSLAPFHSSPAADRVLSRPSPRSMTAE